ncbi:MAG: hypothetical protein JXA20_02355 [Spirochaetes bacterium]|nr:hypothetical protein [Spirochaetota bacterium]
MRKFAITFIVTTLLTTLSCYIINTESGSSRVLLMQSFPYGVTALHAAVYQGTSEESNLLTYQVFRAGQAVTLDVPSGSARIFVVWGEGSTPGIATYYGAAGPVDVATGGEKEVPVAMQAIGTTTFNVDGASTGNYTWNTIHGTTEYELQLWLLRSGPYETVYIGPNTMYNGQITSFNPPRIRATSSVFNLSTDLY